MLSYRERQDGGYKTQKIGNKGNSFLLDDSYAELSPPVSGVDQSGGSGGGEPVTYVHLNPPPHPAPNTLAVQFTEKGQNVTLTTGQMRIYIYLNASYTDFCTWIFIGQTKWCLILSILRRSCTILKMHCADVNSEPGSDHLRRGGGDRTIIHCCSQMRFTASSQAKQVQLEKSENEQRGRSTSLRVEALEKTIVPKHHDAPHPPQLCPSKIISAKICASSPVIHCSGVR